MKMKNLRLKAVYAHLKNYRELYIYYVDINDSIGILETAVKITRLEFEIPKIKIDIRKLLKTGGKSNV